jgi:hypothetical protein
MRTVILGLAAAGLLAACSGDTATNATVEKARADALQPGEYEVTATVAALRSTDNTTPVSKAKPGDPPTAARTCVPADGTIDSAVFAEAGETCNPMDNYMRGGRISLQYKCTRDRQQLTQMVDGEFKADSFTAKVITSTYFTGSGDYELTRNFTGKRVGDCPAAPPTEAP